jgi:hypothetical protein
MVSMYVMSEAYTRSAALTSSRKPPPQKVRRDRVPQARRGRRQSLFPQTFKTQGRVPLTTTPGGYQASQSVRS